MSTKGKIAVAVSVVILVAGLIAAGMLFASSRVPLSTQNARTAIAKRPSTISELVNLLPKKREVGIMLERPIARNRAEVEEWFSVLQSTDGERWAARIKTWNDTKFDDGRTAKIYSLSARDSAHYFDDTPSVEYWFFVDSTDAILGWKER